MSTNLDIFWFDDSEISVCGDSKMLWALMAIMAIIALAWCKVGLYLIVPAVLMSFLKAEVFSKNGTLRVLSSALNKAAKLACTWSWGITFDQLGGKIDAIEIFHSQCCSIISVIVGIDSANYPKNEDIHYKNWFRWKSRLIGRFCYCPSACLK